MWGSTRSLCMSKSLGRTYTGGSPSPSPSSSSPSSGDVGEDVVRRVGDVGFLTGDVGFLIGDVGRLVGDIGFMAVGDVGTRVMTLAGTSWWRC